MTKYRENRNGFLLPSCVKFDSMLVKVVHGSTILLYFPKLDFYGNEAK